MARKAKIQMASQDDVCIQEFLAMIAPSVIKFNTDHFICQHLPVCLGAP